LVTQFLAWLRLWFARKPDPTVTALLQQNEAMMSAVKEMAAASRAQNETFAAYLAMFKTDTAPVGRTMRDTDEWHHELVRRGYPVLGTADEQAKWVLDSTQ